MLKEFINIGFIQTVVEGNIAWPAGTFQMSKESEEKVWAELKKGFVDLMNGYEKPHIIVIPEVSVPHGYELDLRRLANASSCIVIAGLDFYLDDDKMYNRATVIIPSNWPSLVPSRACSHFYFGKTFYSSEEEQIFQKDFTLVPLPEIYIMNAGEFGNIGVAICSDFFDIERFVVYKGRIHHLIIISHNKDTDSYYFLAEAIARLVYCNVIICNTGEFGDSIAFSPAKDSFKRIVYRHKGQGLFSSQVVSLPVESLDKEQVSGVKNILFKSRPPGYIKKKF
ncbi:hypothetical protein [Flavobacterium chilense]|uniref:Carbon-nitrogen hydrolase n=1 Tax=Flavobacterium chilense TaxID=946677 RepID=A0A1M6XEV0_9FLAO|nr:hypothetical protein [Flavobacterium chilense]SHL04514.1 hypothetical protein SAMN05444484_101113 [Flavobacterium chilense]